jgi:hypothetical protein
MLSARILAAGGAGAAGVALYSFSKPATPKVVLGAKQRHAVVRLPSARALRRRARRAPRGRESLGRAVPPLTPPPAALRAPPSRRP